MRLAEAGGLPPPSCVTGSLNLAAPDLRLPVPAQVITIASSSSHFWHWMCSVPTLHNSAASILDGTFIIIKGGWYVSIFSSRWMFRNMFVLSGSGQRLRT